MSSSPTGWLPLVFTTLGAGVAGSLIATYGGGQLRERRKARSEVMASLQRFETARLTRPAGEGFDYDEKDMAELSSRCVLAGIPQYLVSPYQLANEATKHRKPESRPGRPSAEVNLDEAVDFVADALTNDAAALLALAVWHPWLNVFLRRRARKLRDLIIRVFPSANFRDGSMAGRSGTGKARVKNGTRTLSTSSSSASNVMAVRMRVTDAAGGQNTPVVTGRATWHLVSRATSKGPTCPPGVSQPGWRSAGTAGLSSAAMAASSWPWAKLATWPLRVSSMPVSSQSGLPLAKAMRSSAPPRLAVTIAVSPLTQISAP